MPGYCLLEESRTKLLFGHFPRGSYGPLELQARFNLWTSGQYEALLLRAESLDLMRRDERSKRKPRRFNAPEQGRRRRVKKLTGEGADKKAATAATSEPARFTPEEQSRRAAGLLPSSERPDSLFSWDDKGPS